MTLIGALLWSPVSVSWQLFSRLAGCGNLFVWYLDKTLPNAEVLEGLPRDGQNWSLFVMTP